MPAELVADLPRRRPGGIVAGWADAVAARVSFLVAKYYLFGWRVRWRARWRRYDFCHAMEAMSLFAAKGFAARGVPVMLDVTEIPDPFERQGPQFIAASPAAKRHLAAAFARDLPAARALVATSDAMADFVAERFGRATTAIRNARAPLAVPARSAIRDDAGAGPGDCVVAYPCTAAPHLGVEAAIEMLRLLPDRYRLVFVGRFVTPAYRETVERLIRRHALERRVCLKGELADADYLPYLAGADIGLVPLSFAYRNQQLVLPWRVIDLAAAGVPAVASPSESVRRLARERDIGEVAMSASPADLAAAVRRLAAAAPDRVAAIRSGLRGMAADFSPEREAARYRAVLAELGPRRTGRAAFVANLALRRNRRLIGFIDRACALGWRVDLYCVRAPERALFRHPERVRFVAISDRLPLAWLRAAWRLPDIDVIAPFAGIWCGLQQLSRSLRFARAVRAAAARHGPWDIVIATDVFALPAGLAASRRDSFLVYDAVEIPDLRQRTSPYLRRIPAILRLPVRGWERAFVRRAGLILAPSRALAACLRGRYRRGAPPVRTIRNAAPETLAAIAACVPPGLRDRLGLAASDIVLVSPCGISAETGALVAARALRLLPPDHVLVFAGRFSNARVEDRIRAVLNRDRTAHRCFFVGEQDYVTYMRWLGECDIGLVLFDPAVANMRLAAPNRFFDLLAAGVPMIATEIHEAATILRKAGIGGVTRRRPAAVAQAVSALRRRFGIAQGGAIDAAARARLDRVAGHYRADKEMARLVAAVTRGAGDLGGKRVALVTLRSAFSNHRFVRVAAALQSAGAIVAGFDTDVGRAASATAQPGWLTTIPIR